MTARVLVIENDAATLELMFYLLSAHGYLTTTAERGDDGLAAIRSHKPDLVICDLQVPGIDGYTIVGRLKADSALRTVPIVAVSTLATLDDLDRVRAAGFDAHLCKPIDPSTFVAQVAPLLKREPSGTRRG